MYVPYVQFSFVKFFFSLYFVGPFQSLFLSVVCEIELHEFNE